MAGGGVKAGTSYGQSDEWDWKPAEGKTTCHDIYATMLPHNRALHNSTEGRCTIHPTFTRSISR